MSRAGQVCATISEPVNRIIFRRQEIDAQGRVVIADRRAQHVINVLNGTPGRELRVGILDGPCGIAVVESVDTSQVQLICRFDSAMPELPRVDLLLAVPRPKVMRRLWAQLAAIGVGRIVLTNAARVERNYFDTHWLTKSTYEPLLIEGLEQAGDTRLPRVDIIKRLKPFLEDTLDEWFPGQDRLIAQPGVGLSTRRLEAGRDDRLLLAVGPEGGWTDFEMVMFREKGFRDISLGQRTLRTDTACIALLAALSCSWGQWTEALLLKDANKEQFDCGAVGLLSSE